MTTADERRAYLVVSAHPDDADFGVAGTAARLIREGHAVHYLLCTSGDAGGEDPAQPAEELQREREAEQRAAGAILGLTGIEFLRQPDGELVPDLLLRRAITRAIRAVKADVVLCQDPRQLVNDEGTYLNHPDHRAAGQATLDAVFPAAGNPRAFMSLLGEGFAPHKVRELWLFFTTTERANHWVDITDTFELKVRALSAHVSQIGDWAANGALRREVARWASDEARRRELGYTYAEGFQRIVLERAETPADEPAEPLAN